MAAIAGIITAVAFSLVDTWTRSATGVCGSKFQVARADRAGAELRSDAAGRGHRDLCFASARDRIGVPDAMLMFIRSDIKQPIRQIVHAIGELRARSVRRAKPSRCGHTAHGS